MNSLLSFLLVSLLVFSAAAVAADEINCNLRYVGNDELTQFITEFSLFDTDGNGSLSEAELVAFYQANMLTFPGGLWASLLRDMDSNGNSEIEREEYVAFVACGPCRQAVCQEGETCYVVGSGHSCSRLEKNAVPRHGSIADVKKKADYTPQDVTSVVCRRLGCSFTTQRED